MKRHQQVRNIVLSLLVTATSIPLPSAFAQRTAPRGDGGNIDITQAPQRSVSCGPHLKTFVVKPLDNRQGVGIRCVKFSEGNPGLSNIPRIAWYGEGNWGGGTYSHMGHAFYRGSNLAGYASDICDGTRTICNNFPGNLKVQIVNPSTIRVTGAWNEEWQLVNAANYKPLPRITSCGRYLQEYKVSDLAGRRRGSGLRCALRELPSGFSFRLPLVKPVTTWFGNGDWNGNRYTHLGTFSHNGYGASDICGLGDPICNTFGWGSLKFNSVPGGLDVTGAWSEKWR